MNLTQDERKVILFLAAVFLLGLGVNFVFKQLVPDRSLAGFSDNLGRINLNTADGKLLTSIAGIGEKLSSRILEFRLAQGGFRDIEELKSVKGITETKFNQIKDYISAE